MTLAGCRKLGHVAVIGAGMTGLKAIKELRAAGIKVTAFELSNDIGGIWRFTEEESLSSVYRSTRINTIRATNAFGDFPVPEDRGYQVNMTHQDMMGYFRDYAKEFNLLENIRFETRVTRVEPCEDSGKNGTSWRLRFHGPDNKAEEGVFDGVVICSGHHSTPHMPSFKGMESFPGKLMHSHSYKDNTPFEGKRCVVVGIGNSGSDIVTEVSKVAKETILVARRGTWMVKNSLHDPNANAVSRLEQNVLGRLPKHVGADLAEEGLADSRAKLEKAGLAPTFRFNEGHPTITGNCADNDFLKQLDAGKISGRRGIEHFDGSTVHFTDGSQVEADAVIMCTGYEIGYPFLDSDVLEVRPDRHLDLYKYMFPVGPREVHNIAFVGVVQQIGAMSMICDVQSRVVARYMAGELALPSRQKMKQDIEAKRAFNAEWYYDAPRHSVEVSVRPYLDEIGEMISATPTFWRILLRAPWLLGLVYSTPTCGGHYRLVGYGADVKRARYNMTKEYNVCYGHMANRRSWSGYLEHKLKVYGVLLPMAIFYQLKSLLTTGKTFFFAWE
ncbi:Dimethylaniline monooxygenase N-oxide-forming 2 [Hondaea fermentalgiana]|uniref:Flavin-containing monooxygenase 1 n=1 Tax=Hondaea fermentalgiana TaxID=2315210 RepID=A0A2R5G7H9_9STRA|nr:Dimethylaniline monooxygenase N-oxide-forming 2 [Hondaea fermentalgiana]|eukprot:GBG25748.1 Dimethylaniline monooxygenase N-oxide-forming 2 [Hondaea fermentalgiana]